MYLVNTEILDSNRWALTTSCTHTSQWQMSSSTGARDSQKFLGKFKLKSGKGVSILFNIFKF